MTTSSDIANLIFITRAYGEQPQLHLSQERADSNSDAHGKQFISSPLAATMILWPTDFSDTTKGRNCYLLYPPTRPDTRAAKCLHTVQEL